MRRNLQLVGFLIAFAASARAQSEIDLPAQAQPAQTQGAVVFLLAPELSPTIRASLTDALEAQLTATGTTLHWLPMTSVGTDLRAAIDQGKPVAAEHSAAGVFWLDASGASDWLLYLMDATGERVLVRRMEAAATSPAASVEAIAVIVRESAAAMIAGRPIAMDPLPPPVPITPVAPTPAPPVPTVMPVTPPPTPIISAPSEEGPGMLRFALSYVGSPLSNDVPWQSGLGLQVAAFTDSGLFAGIAYTLLPAVTARDQGYALSIHRRPVRLVFGAGLELGRRFRWDAEAAALLDVATRTTLTTPQAAAPTEDDTKPIFGAGLAARINWTPQPSVELYLSLGAEVFFNRFDYVSEVDGAQQTLLSPWPVSPTAELGIAFRP